jgi:hypothetical protein
MKKIILTLIWIFVVTATFSQNNNTTQRFKYVTVAPDGSIAMTIHDDVRKETMILTAADNFYRYDIVEPTTSETLYSANNKGKECTIDKTKIQKGTYDIRLYTSSFIITSKITITATRKMNSTSYPSKNFVASRE